VRLLLGGMAIVAALAALGPRAISPRLDLPAVQELERARADFIWRENWGLSPLENYEIPSLSARSTLLVGDSHMTHYIPRVAAAIKADPYLATAVVAASDGCPPLPGMNLPGFQCPAFFDYWTTLAQQGRISTIAISAYWDKYLTGVLPLMFHGHPATASDYEESWDGLAMQLRNLVRAGKRVVIFTSSPFSTGFDPAFGFDRLFPARGLRLTAMPRATVERNVEPATRRLNAIVRFSGAESVSPLDYLCRGDECPALDTDGTPIYHDPDHIRASKAATLATFVDDVLRLRPAKQ